MLESFIRLSLTVMLALGAGKLAAVLKMSAVLGFLFLFWNAEWV